MRVAGNTSDSRTLIAAIDSGFGLSGQTHPRVVCSNSAHWVGKDSAGPAVSKCECYADTLGHGTKCGNIVLSIAQECLLMPIRIFDSELSCEVWELCAALELAASTSARVILLSLAMDGPTPDIRLARVCLELERKGVVIVAATRNADQAGFPSEFDCVLGVGLGRKRSNDEVTCRPDDAAEIVVPAGKYVSVGADERIEVSSTSAAAAVVAGVVARAFALRDCHDLASTRKLLATRGNQLIQHILVS